MNKKKVAFFICLLSFMLILGTAATASAAGNIALDKPAVASSIQSEVETEDLAIKYINDGKMGTRWGSEFSEPHWFHIDLQEESVIAKIVVAWEAAYARHYEISVSNDAEEWTTIHEEKNSRGKKEEIILDEPVTARYIKMDCIRRMNPEWGFSIWEFEVYSSPEGGAETVEAGWFYEDLNQDNLLRTMLVILGLIGLAAL